MKDTSIYRDIAKRTGGDIYIGVVGPVRTGKSTFIHKVLDELIIPNIEGDFDKQRANDEAPQSASGRTIMTTEPKFVPDEAVKITTDDGTTMNVKLIDCVGYVVDGSLGGEEEGAARMVQTPWSDEPMEFSRAAEIGTDKVIRDHSTVAVLVTTDGSIGEIKRESYVPAEEKIADELKKTKRPFAIVLNSKNPGAEEARALAESLEEKYDAPVALVNCASLSSVDISEILKLILSEFPIKEMRFKLPKWTKALPESHEINVSALKKIKDFSENAQRLLDIDKQIKDNEFFEKVSVNAADGTAEFNIPLAESVFYETLSEASGIEIDDEYALFSNVLRLSKTEKEYKKIESALSDAREKGYGIVMPSPEELTLEEPKVSKQNGGFGVKVSAKADSIHMIKAGIKAELCPIVGTEEQTEEVVKYLLDEFESDPKRIWESNMFGKSLYDLVNDGMNAKLINIPDESRSKLSETLERVVNEGANGLICILL